MARLSDSRSSRPRPPRAWEVMRHYCGNSSGRGCGATAFHYLSFCLGFHSGACVADRGGTDRGNPQENPMRSAAPELEWGTKDNLPDSFKIAGIPVDGKPVPGPAAGRRLDDSKFMPRREAVFIPAGAKSIRLTLWSGAPDTTGLIAIDGDEKPGAGTRRCRSFVRCTSGRPSRTTAPASRATCTTTLAPASPSSPSTPRPSAGTWRKIRKRPFKQDQAA